MPLRIPSMPRATPGPCPVCGAQHQTCVGGDPSGRYSRMFVNDYPLSDVTATEPLYRPRAGARGDQIMELAYTTGERVRARDLGLVYTASGEIIHGSAAPSTAAGEADTSEAAGKRTSSRLENKRRRVRLEDKGAYDG